jgi:ubiquinone/menaquinone biosynthesis C-methylase UbiE
MRGTDKFIHLFIDPATRGPLVMAVGGRFALSATTAYPVENGVIDFFSPRKLSPSPNLAGTWNTGSSDHAPELREAHDKAFEEAAESGGNIYGSFESLPQITQSGHYRRMELLAATDLGEIATKVAVDFGTGPWSFGAIFPALRGARICIGFDISKVALRQARNCTAERYNAKIVYATADGDFVPLADDSVDIFFGGEVIEHVRNPALFVQEIARVCKDGALVILSTPNKDAFAYCADAQQYAVGPEHIALMNPKEFRQVIERFCTVAEIAGYETSLGPELDKAYLTADMLDRIQKRSHRFPELSSGMVAVATVDKQKYRQNKRSLKLREYLWDSTALCVSPSMGRAIPLFGNVGGLLMTSGMSIRCPIAGSEPVLLFWGHDWSGEVEVTAGELTVSRNLYQRTGGFVRVDLSVTDPAVKEVLVRSTGRKDARSHSDQVIFYKALDYAEETADFVPLPLRQSDGLQTSGLLAKHKKMQDVLCCPQCKGHLSYPSAVTISDVLIHGEAVCASCGIVGKVANLKHLFNEDPSPAGKRSVEEKCAGRVSVHPIELQSHHFSPDPAWPRSDDGRFFSERAGAKFSVCTSSAAIALVFLKHPWSGIASISVDGVDIGTVDLFEEHGSMKMWYPLHLGFGSHLVEVRNTGEKNPKSNAPQVWLLEMEALNVLPAAEDNIQYPSRNEGNPYPEKFEALLCAVPKDGLILDCGCGDRSHPDPRVVNFEYSLFPGPDVFGDGHRLPFKDDSFDLILSQAVVEHLYDPFAAVQEIWRVLKPGGVVYCESAFMQPLHAVPYHFFNTTVWGIERLFKDFEIHEVGSEGALSDTLSWLYRLTKLREKGFSEKVDQLLTISKELDSEITREERKHFSSYVTLLASKQVTLS